MLAGGAILNDESQTARVHLTTPLRNSTFRAIWVATIGSNFGGLIQGVGAAWMMTTLTREADMVALVQASTTLPLMIFSLAAGALADNFDRRKVMLVAQGFMLTVSVALSLSAWFGLIGPWGLLGFTFLIGCGAALNNPAWQASVGDMVPRAEVPAAVALNSISFNITRSVGPAIGGAIVATAGAAAAFAVNAFSYLGLIFVLLRWRPSFPPAVLPRESIGAAMGAGLRYVAMSPNILTVLLRSFLFGLTSVAVLALLPLVASENLQGGPVVYGGLLGGYGIGAVLGAYLGTRLRERLSSEWIVRLAFTGFAACAILLAVGSHFAIAAIGTMIGGACWVLALALFNTTVQLSAPRWVLARALALYQTAAFGGMALGSWIWGLVAEARGLSHALLIAATMMLAGALVGVWLRLPNRADLNLDPLNRFVEPTLALALKPRSGPILVEVAYRILEEDIPAFLEAIAERQRIRRRDGARHWTLLRDLEDPEIWLESYQTATWVEYIRHNRRRTQADAEVGDRILALHRGPERPRVYRRIVRQARWNGSELVPKPALDHH